MYTRSIIMLEQTLQPSPEIFLGQFRNDVKAPPTENSATCASNDANVISSTVIDKRCHACHPHKYSTQSTTMERKCCAYESLIPFHCYLKMSPPTLPSSPSLVLDPSPLSQSLFHPYGSAIISPIPLTSNNAPANVSSLPVQQHVTAPALANQGSAVKHSPISSMQSTYGTGTSKLPGSPRMSLFSCFPRNLRAAESKASLSSSSSSKLFDVRLLERHPFTSQTFIPLSYGQDGENNGAKMTTNSTAQGTAAAVDEPCYLVVVAPTLVGQTVRAAVGSPSSSGKRETVLVHDPPDLKNMKAFLAGPGQAVTYSAGTWHAPMVVLGRRRVDFVVTQFMNGILEEDCQEVELRDGIVVEIGDEVVREGSAKAKL